MSDEYSDYYDGLDFEDFKFWDDLQEALTPVFEFQRHLKFFLAFIGVFVNIFHLIVLTRKSMRVLTINLFPIGIGICDFLRLLSDFLVALPEYYEKYQMLAIPPYCIPPKTYLVFFVQMHSITLSMVAQKLAVWFGVAMAVLRVFVIKYPLGRRIQNLIRSQYGIRIFLIVCLPHMPFWLLDFQMSEIRKFKIWKRPSSCTNFTEVTKRILYTVDSGESSNETMLQIEGVLFTVLPSILLLVATGILIYYLNTMKRSTGSRKNDNNDRSTKMVILVTVTFVIATAPLGMMYFIRMTELGYGISFAIDMASVICETLSLINGTLHFLLCAFISSQYQSAVRDMFGLKKTRITTVTLAS